MNNAFFSVEDFLAARRSKYFWVEREEGKYRFGHPGSFYAAGSDPEEASFDIGNNKVIICVTPGGEIRYLTFFEESEYNDNIPGVWVHKKSKVFKDLSFSVVKDGVETRLSGCRGKVRTGLAGCVIPVTEYHLPGLLVTLIYFTPITADGSSRPRAAYCIIHLKNTSSQTNSCTIKIPEAMHFSDAMDNNALPPDIRMEDGSRREGRSFTLAPGADDKFAVFITAYGEEEQQESNALYWLRAYP